MRSRIFAWSALALCLVPATFAASVDGRVTFVTKRGQNPVVNETLLWLEPASARQVRRAPGTYQMFTRGKMLLPQG